MAPYKPAATKAPAKESGSLFEVVKHEAVNLTPEKAEHYMKLNTYEAQRLIKDKNLAELVDNIDEGKWRSAEISFAIMPSGREILVNGQHTLKVCIRSGDNIFVFLVWYKVSGKKGLSGLYRTFDLGRSARSIGDAVKAELAYLGLKWPVPIASLVSTAAIYIETGMFRGKLGKAKQSALLRKYTEMGGFVVTLYEEDKRGFKHLKRSPVVTAIAKTYTASPDEAWTFWTSVRDGIGNGPAKVLHDYLKDQPETWDRKALYAKCIEAFNSYALGEASVTWAWQPTGGKALPEPTQIEEDAA